MSSSYHVLPLSRSFPKIAVVCGAHTKLGQQILHELLYSSEIEKVYAIASTDIDIMSRVDRSVARKASVLITPLDGLRRAISRIPEADVAFCALGTERHTQNTIGMKRFQQNNFEGPRVFVKGMFKLGVLYIAVLSHVYADKKSRSELFKVRGELEDYVRDLRKEAAEYSPFISMFKVASMVGQNDGASSSSGHRLRRQDDTVEFNELATAMKVDALTKSATRRSSDPIKKRKYKEYYVSEIRRLNGEGKYGIGDDSEGESEGTPFWLD